MPEGTRRSTLTVEGPDDQEVIRHLLRRHGAGGTLDPSEPLPPEYPEFKKAGGIDSLLRGISTAVRLGTDLAVGFVLDADSPLSNRWQAVRDRLRRVGVETPQRPSAAGFIGRSEEYQTTVGVWLMPDNQHDGTLETFLRELVESADPLIAHAESATDEASRQGARYSKPDRPKAILHAWLAWQERPGVPFGTAIGARYFRHDSPAAAAFVAWFRRLYGIDDRSTPPTSPSGA